MGAGRGRATPTGGDEWIGRTRRAHRQRYLELQGELMGHLAWDEEQLRSERNHALHRLLDHARSNSPFHARRLPASSNVDERDLSAIPVMTKDDLMAHFDDVVTDRRVRLNALDEHLDGLGPEGAYFLDSYTAVASGGSSGRRGVFVYSWDGWATSLAQATRFHAVGDVIAGLCRVLFPVPAPAEPGAPWVHIAAASAAHMTRAFVVTVDHDDARRYIPATTPLRELVAMLDDLEPDGIFAYSSILVALAREALAGRLRIAPSWVMAASEPFTRGDAQVVHDAWGIWSVSSYGTSEGLLVGWCVAGRCHLPDDLVIVEPVDEEGRPVARGTTSAKILITNLYNRLQPLIRYEITDRMTVHEEPCPCGAAFSTIGPVEGRTDDFFRYGEEVVVHPHALRSPLTQRAVVEYQVLQRPAGIEVRVVAGDDLDVPSLRADLASALSHAGLHSPVVEIERVDALPRQQSGKLRRFVPLPGPR